jgi:hypothetical protein
MGRRRKSEYMNAVLFPLIISSEEKEKEEKKANKKRGQNIKIGELNKIDTSVKTIIKEAKKIGLRSGMPQRIFL